jgi:pimeloyl-ACP methyl ester carboxylesterase
LIAVVMVALVGVIAFATAERVAAPMIVQQRDAGEGPIAADVPQDVDRALEWRRGGVTLRAWLLEPDRARAPRGTILLLHGRGSGKIHMLGMARRLSQVGFVAVAIDLRAHGESTGARLTYGIEESQDLAALLDELAREGSLSAPVGVLGFSYGAATAILLAAGDARIEAVIAVAPFASFRELVEIYARRMVPLGEYLPQWHIDRVIARAGEEAGFDPDAACPACAARRTRARLLLIHSRDDRAIPASQSAAIARARPDAELILIDGVDHAATLGARGVYEAVEPWFLAHL